MKRVLQFVALFVAILLAAQPALAGLPCGPETSSNGACASGCAMAVTTAPMSQTASGCGMTPQVSSNGCEQSCCASNSLQSVSQPATGAKSKADRVLHFVAAPDMDANATSAFTAQSSGEPVTSAPPRYILLQVFRI
jgi:hypothetical protein